MSIKILHSSDWHLGKKLFKQSRIEEQALFLRWLENYLVESKIDILLIAGDIFDTPTPPNDALKLYFNFLNNLTKLDFLDTIIISGNHDSSSFIEAPSALLNQHHIHIRTRLSKDINDNHIHLRKKGKDVIIKTLPYFRSYDIYNLVEEKKESELSQEETILFIKSYLNNWPKDITKDAIKITMAHHAFGDFAATGSEHVLHLAGLESLSTKWFDRENDYIALGHIHKTQKMDKEKEIYYSGSPIPLRFSEKQKKFLLEYNSDSKETNKIEIPDFRKVIQINSKKEELISDLKLSFKENTHTSLPSYYELKVIMEEPDNHFIDSVYKLFKDNNHELLSLIPLYNSDENDAQESNLENLSKIHGQSLTEIFEEYYFTKYPDSKNVPKAISDRFKDLINEVHNEN